MSLFGDINKVELLGNLTQEPELRFTPSGAAVCNISIATNRRFKQGEEWKDETEFHNIVIWANLAQQVEQRASKGTRVLVTGRLQTRSWEGPDGQKKYKTEIVADDVFLIDRYERGKVEPGGSFTPQSAPQQSAPAKEAKAAYTDKPAKAQAAPETDDINPDDLPF